MNRTATTTPTIRRVRTVYQLINTAHWFAIALPFSMAVLYAQSRGIDLFQVGLGMALYAVTVAAMEIPSGLMADTLGRRRTAMLAYGLTAAAMVALLFTFSMPMFIAYGLLYGLARALTSGTLQAWFVDALLEADPEVELQPALAAANSYELLALAVGTWLGGYLPRLFEHLPTGATSLLTPLSIPLLASLAVETMVLAATWLWVRERRRPSTKDRGAAALEALRDAWRLSGRQPVVRRLLGVAALGGVAVIGLETFRQPFFSETLGMGHGSTDRLGMIFAGCFLAGVAGNLWAAALSRRLGHRHAVVAALLLLVQIAAMLLLAWQRSLPPAVVCFWLIYFAAAGSGPSLAALFHAQIPSSRRAVMLSVQSMAFFVGASLGSLLLGWLVEAASIRLAWTVAAAIATAGIGLLLGTERNGGRVQNGPGPRRGSASSAPRAQE